MTTITLNIDDEALALLNSIVAIRFVGGASGPIESMMLSILSSVKEGKEKFLVAGCEGKVVVEAIE